MAVEPNTVPVGENGQVTLTAPEKGALAVRRVDNSTVRVYPLSEADLLALLGEDGHVELPDDVLEFSREQGIVEYVERAMQAAREVFAGADRVTASLKSDEYGEPYVDIDVVVGDDPEAEAEKYSACVEKWATLIPPQAGGKIQLSTAWA
jgi:hypothetical protein